MDIVQIEHGLCEPCRHLLQDGLRDEGARYAHYLVPHSQKRSNNYEVVVDHHTSFEAFSQSAARGCHVCALLLSQRNPDEKQELLSHQRGGSAQMEYISFEPHHPKHGVEVEIIVSYDVYDLGHWKRSWNQTLDLSDSAVFRNKTMSLQMWSTGEEPCSATNNAVDVRPKWEQMASWISTCRRNHKTCVPVAGRDWDGPAYLIEIGDRTDFGDVRVCEDVPANELYVTLSHCWGPTGVPVQLLKCNCALYLQSLPWHELPKTFQDAILVVRALRPLTGVHYLWIDALCIVQDSDEDKSIEISRMGGIYQGALCNLAASIGSDCHSGLVTESTLVPPHECIVDWGTSDKQHRRMKIGNRHAYDVLVQRSDLSKRAWVLQEIILAPRVLFFTPEQLVWECSEACYYETTGMAERQKEFELRFKLLPIHHLASRDVWQVYNFWHRCLQGFSGRKLSFGSDRLRAIAAIANAIEGQLGRSNRYLVGLWSEHLHIHLTWEVDQPTNLSHRDRLKSAFPSWSWASLDAPIDPVYFFSDTLRNSRACMEIRPNIRHTDGVSRFDTPAVAELDITGVVFKVHIWIDYNPPESMKKRPASVWTKGDIRMNYDPRGYQLDFSTRLDYRRLDGAKIITDKYDEEEEEEEEEVLSAYCVFVSMRKVAGSFRNSGLLLLRVPGRRGHYYRIGICTAESGRLEGEKLNDHVLSEDEYVELVEKHSYRITVI